MATPQILQHSAALYILEDQNPLPIPYLVEISKLDQSSVIEAVSGID